MSKVKLNLRKVATGVACLAVCMVFSTCGKDGNDGRDGRDGKDGTNGINGIDGAQGTQGIPGNAGVKMYVWGSTTIEGCAAFDIPNITPSEVKNSLICAYFSTDGNYWVAVPRPYQGTYAVTCMHEPKPTLCTFHVCLRDADVTEYSTPVTWSAFRIIVVPIPEGNITEVKSVGKGYPVDWSNYKEVAAYFGLPE
jgi:hypothetical protein